MGFPSLFTVKAGGGGPAGGKLITLFTQWSCFWRLIFAFFLFFFSHFFAGFFHIAVERTGGQILGNI